VSNRKPCAGPTRGAGETRSGAREDFRGTADEKKKTKTDEAGSLDQTAALCMSVSHLLLQEPELEPHVAIAAFVLAAVGQ